MKCVQKRIITVKPTRTVKRPRQRRRVVGKWRGKLGHEGEHKHKHDFYAATMDSCGRRETLGNVRLDKTATETRTEKKKKQYSNYRSCQHRKISLLAVKSVVSFPTFPRKFFLNNLTIRRLLHFINFSKRLTKSSELKKSLAPRPFPLEVDFT